MKIDIIGFVICIVILVFSISGLRENIAALLYVFLAFGSGIGLTYFGWNLVCSLLD